MLVDMPSIDKTDYRFYIRSVLTAVGIVMPQEGIYAAHIQTNQPVREGHKI